MGTLIDWCEINSGSQNLSGLARMHDRLKIDFAPLGDTCESIPLQPCQKYDESGEPFDQELGAVLRLRCRPTAPIQILFSGHYDTVYGASHPFQKCEVINGGKALRGPGTADMKGGLLVMHEALRLFESFPGKETVGWEILLNPEEEIGTPGARDLLREAAARHHFGLVFEPSTMKGALVHRRLGTGFFRAVVHGKTAHAGRDVSEGRNAIEALSAVIVAFRQRFRSMPGVIVNVARIHSAFPLNAVPDRAVAQFNIRAADDATIATLDLEVQQILRETEAEYEVKIEWDGGFDRPPRTPDSRVGAMENAMESCLRDLDQPFSWRDTGGGTDGSLLLSYGLPNLDSLGVRGDFLHSDQESIDLDSLVERVHLTTLFLTRIAKGEIEFHTFSRS